MSGDTAQETIDILDLTEDDNNASFDESFPKTKARLEDIRDLVGETAYSFKKVVRRFNEEGTYNLLRVYRKKYDKVWIKAWAEVVKKRRQQQRPAPDPVQAQAPDPVQAQAPPSNFPSRCEELTGAEASSVRP